MLIFKKVTNMDVKLRKKKGILVDDLLQNKPVMVAVWLRNKKAYLIKMFWLHPSYKFYLCLGVDCDHFKSRRVDNSK